MKYKILIAVCQLKALLLTGCWLVLYGLGRVMSILTYRDFKNLRLVYQLLK